MVIFCHTAKLTTMYLQWSNEDPPEEWEFTRNARIREKQGNGNPFVEMFETQ